MKQIVCALIATVFLMLLPYGASWAQPVPDAGTILQQVEPRSPGLEKEPPPELIPPQAPPKEAGPESAIKVEVKGFSFTGNTKVSTAELQKTVKPFVGRWLSINELQAATAAVTRLYKEKGFFTAKAYLPPQEIKDGLVQILVVEGHLETDGVELENPGNRISDDFARSLLEYNLGPGQVIEADQFERALLLLNDMPGLSVHATLYPGKTPGTARIQAVITETALVNGNVDVDNFGSYGTGQYRLGSTVYINSPFGWGEMLTLRGVTTFGGLNYIYGNLALPITPSGLKVGATSSYLDYKLQDEYESLDAKGFARTFSAYAIYPFIRTRHKDLIASLIFRRNELNDDALGQNTSDRVVDSITLLMTADLRDKIGGGGLNTFNLEFEGGDLDLGGNPAWKALDQQTTQADGGFVKLTWSVARLQALGGPFSCFLALAGQHANGNLDSSEKFTLGGPLSVRGYPVGATYGDEGYRLNFDIRYDLPQKFFGGHFQAAAFYDQGWIRLHKDPWNGWQGGNPLVENTYDLKSVGLAISQTWPQIGLIRAAFGYQLGDNPGRNPTTNKDVDFSDSKFRVWIQAILYF